MDCIIKKCPPTNLVGVIGMGKYPFTAIEWMQHELLLKYNVQWPQYNIALSSSQRYYEVRHHTLALFTLYQFKACVVF